MGFLKKLKFWKKRNIKKPTKVDADVSTEDPRNSDASAVTVEQTNEDACCPPRIHVPVMRQR